MGNRMPDYGIDSANEMERDIWKNVLIGSAAVLATATLGLLLVKDKQGSDSPMPTAPSSVDMSFEP